MRIQALNPAGNIAAEFPSIQAAGRAGYSLQRVHACLHGKARSHRGLTWRRVDGLYSLPQFFATELVESPGNWLTINDTFQAFLAWLPLGEREAVNRQDFGVAMGRLVKFKCVAGCPMVADFMLRKAFTVPMAVNARPNP